MKNSLTSAARIALAFSLCAFSPLAEAQNVAASGAFTAATLNDINFAPTPQNCVIMGTAVSTPITLTFTFPPTVLLSDVSWRVAGGVGDFTLVSGYAQGTTGTPVPNATTPTGSVFQVRPTGMGKMRVTLTYTVDGGCVPRTFICGGVQSTAVLVPSRTVVTRSFDFFKSFNAPDPIVGPTCVQSSSTTPAITRRYTWSVKPVLTGQPQIQAAIGTDTYTWSGYPVGYFFYESGDKSSLTLQMPAGAIAPFTLTVQVGKCNAGTVATLLVTPVQDLNAAITGFPVCRAVNATGSFTFTVAGVTGIPYSIRKPATWTVTPLTFVGNTVTPQTVTVTPDANFGEMAITSTQCDVTQVVFKPLTRSLITNTGTPVDNYNTPTFPAGTPGCLVSGTGYALTIPNAPTGSTFTWTVPAGFNGLNVTSPIVTTSPTLTLTPNLATATTPAPSSATIQVTSDGCTSGVVNRIVSVGTGQQCAYTISRINGRSFIVESTTMTVPGGQSCTPTASDPGNTGTTYFWTSEATGLTWTSNNPIGTWGGATPTTIPFGFINVRIVNPNNCLDVTWRSATAIRPGPRGGTTPGGSTPQLGADGFEPVLVAYPNPVGDVLRVALSVPEGATARLTLTDVTGRTVASTTAHGISSALDVKALPTGFYTLRAELPAGKVLSQKVQITH